MPVFFAVATGVPSRQATAYRAMQSHWDAASQLFSPPFERVRIPYGRTALPGYFLRPPGPRRRRPTVILNNGNDAQNIDLYTFGGAAALERGYNALIFEGPGQGSVFFLRKIPFRPDWEKVITPVVDFLYRRTDVDRSRIGIIGWSQGGELVARAAAFEKRLAAMVLDPGGVDLLRGLPVPQELKKLVADGKRKQANDAWSQIFPKLPVSTRTAYTKLLSPFGRKDFYDQIRYLGRFDVSRVAGCITAPTLITEYQFDDFFAGQPQQLYRLLRSKKRLVRFNSNYGTEYHDAPMAPQRRNQVIFDWLDDTLG
jgi:pimeloyl-ACP methyl ester carboxylesterase